MKRPEQTHKRSFSEPNGRRARICSAAFSLRGGFLLVSTAAGILLRYAFRVHNFERWKRTVECRTGQPASRCTMQLPRTRTLSSSESAGRPLIGHARKCGKTVSPAEIMRVASTSRRWSVRRAGNGLRPAEDRSRPRIQGLTIHDPVYGRTCTPTVTNLAWDSWSFCHERHQVPKCILIVDDSALIRRMIRETLEQHAGWEVSGEAVNGREAIEKAQQLKPDLIVLDLSMPVMNGLEAARVLKGLFPSLPLVMFTNFDTPQLTNEALSAGVSAVVSKSKLAGVVDEIQALLEPVS